MNDEQNEIETRKNRRKRRKNRQQHDEQVNEDEDSNVINNEPEPSTSNYKTSVEVETDVSATRLPRRKVQLVENVDDINRSAVTAKRKQNQRKTPKHAKAELAEDFYADDLIVREISQLKDDIITDNEIFKNSPQKTKVWHTNVIPNSYAGKTFIEYGDAFKAVDKQKLAKSLENNHASQADQEDSAKAPPLSVQIGLSIHVTLQKVAKYCYGILAGFALWQCIMVYLLAPPRFTLQDFVIHYSAMASTAEAMFYVLFSICIFSLMGSCNIGGEESNLIKQVLTFHSGLFALFLYLVTLVLSLSVANVEDMLSLCSNHNCTNDDIQRHENQIYIWKNVNCCRCIGSILAWFILALWPHQNYLINFFENTNM